MALHVCEVRQYAGGPNNKDATWNRQAEGIGGSSWKIYNL